MMQQRSNIISGYKRYGEMGRNTYQPVEVGGNRLVMVEVYVMYPSLVSTQDHFV